MTRRPVASRAAPVGRLLRIGFVAGRGAPGDRLRAAALLIASCVLAMVASAFVIAAATYDGRVSRDEARGPVVTTDRQKAVAWWAQVYDSLENLQHTVVYVEPLDASAPPPPGLARWPAPGEAVLSPELAERGAAQGIRSRYGRFGGFIGQDGLVARSERLVYVRPPQPPNRAERDTWHLISGFGRPYPFVETLNQRGLPEVLLAIGVLAFVPALALMAVAARCGSQTRDRRSALLQALGGAWWHRALMNIGEGVFPVAIGTAIGSSAFIVAGGFDLPVPGTGYVLTSDDIRSAWPLALAALATCFTLALLIVVGLHRTPNQHQGTRPRAFAAPVPRWRLILGGAAVGLIALSQYLPGSKGLVAFALGTVGMWTLLPSAAAAVSMVWGRRLAVRGAARGHTGRLIGGRWTAAQPGVIVRLSTAMIIMLGVVTQLQVWQSRLGESATAALATEQRIGDSLVVVRTAGPSNLDRFARALPETSHVLAVTALNRGSKAVLTGTCASLRLLALPCTPAATPAPLQDARLRELSRWYGLRSLSSRAARPGTEADRNLIVVVSDTPGQADAVHRAAYTTLPTIEVATPGSTWIDGAVSRGRLGAWLVLFGLAGLLALLPAVWIGAAAEFARFRGALAPLIVLTGRYRVFWSAAWWHLTVPLLSATGLALLVTAWHGLFFISVVQEGALAWGVLAASGTACVALAAAVGVFGARSAIRASRSWRPTAD